MRGSVVAVGGHGVGVTRQHHPPVAPERGAGDQVGADPLDLQVREGPQPGLQVVGQGRLGVAGRRDVDQRRGQGEQVRVGHGPTLRGTGGRAGTVSRRDRPRTLHRWRPRLGPRHPHRPTDGCSTPGSPPPSAPTTPARPAPRRWTGRRRRPPSARRSQRPAGPTRCATSPCRRSPPPSPTCRPRPSTPTTPTSGSTCSPTGWCGPTRSTWRGSSGTWPPWPGPSSAPSPSRTCPPPSSGAGCRARPCSSTPSTSSPGCSTTWRPSACGSPTPTGCGSAPTWPRAPR